jgi:hypothetical protein
MEDADEAGSPALRQVHLRWGRFTCATKTEGFAKIALVTPFQMKGRNKGSSSLCFCFEFVTRYDMIISSIIIFLPVCKCSFKVLLLCMNGIKFLLKKICMIYEYFLQSLRYCLGLGRVEIDVTEQVPLSLSHKTGHKGNPSCSRHFWVSCFRESVEMLH